MQGYSIDEWCEKHRISRGTWYNLNRAGKGPRYMMVGSRIVITAEWDAQWCREREVATAAVRKAANASKAPSKSRVTQ